MWGTQLSAFHFPLDKLWVHIALHMKLIFLMSDIRNSHLQESSAHSRIAPIIANDRDSAEVDFHLRDVTIESE